MKVPPTSTPDIRGMTTADLPAVMAIQAACYTELVPESQASLEAKRAASPSTCLVAARDGTVIGYLFALPWTAGQPPALDARTCELPSEPDCLYLHDLSVAPIARQGGTGRALVEAFRARMAVLGLARAALVAVQDSVPYWERYGFRMAALAAPRQAALATYGRAVAYMELDTAHGA